MGVIWAAYKAGSFQLKEGLTQQEFVDAIEEYFKRFSQVWVIDDRSASFSQNRGQIGLVLTISVDLIVETRFWFFKWATRRNILRGVAAFLNMIKHSTKTGICMVRTTRDKRGLPDHLKDYDLLYYVGKTAQDEFLYTIRGRAS